MDERLTKFVTKTDKLEEKMATKAESYPLDCGGTEITGLRRVPRVEDPSFEFRQVAIDLGWLLKEVRDPEPEAGKWLEYVFLDEASGTGVYCIAHQIVGFWYVTAHGPREVEVAALLSERLNCWTDPEMFTLWDQGVANDDVDDRVDAVLLLGVSAPMQPELGYQERLLAALGDDDSDVRNAAVQATTCRGWPVFRPVLERLRDEDVDEVVRQRASIILENWRALDEGAINDPFIYS
jgi:hypothetical protein